MNHSYNCKTEEKTVANGAGIDVGFTYGVSVSGAPVSVSIANNEVGGFPGHGISVVADLAGAEFPDTVDLTGSLAGNTLTSIGGCTSTPCESGSVDILTDDTDHFKIASNKLSATGTGAFGISAGGGSNCAVTQNTIENFTYAVAVEQTSFATVNFNTITKAGFLGGINFTCVERSSIGFNSIEGSGASSLGGIILYDCGPGFPQPGSDHNSVVLNSTDDFCAGILTGPSDNIDNDFDANAYHVIGPGTDEMVGITCP